MVRRIWVLCCAYWVFFVMEDLSDYPSFNAIQLPRDLKILIAMVLPIFVLNRLIQYFGSKKTGETLNLRSEIFTRGNPQLHKAIAFFVTLLVIYLLWLR